MKKQWIASSAFASVWLTAALASAATYLCNADYIPGSGSPGTLGNVGITAYTGPHCTGSFIANYTLCSSGATNALCVNNSLYWATSVQALTAIATAMREAALFAYPVTLVTQTCLGAGTNCVALVNIN